MTLAAQSVKVKGRLEEASCVLHQGQITAICGPNGAGKSSLLQVLAGLLTPDSGRVTLGECDLASVKQRARQIGYLPQAPDIAWDVTVRRLVELGRIAHNDRAAGPVDAAIAALDLGPFEDRRAQALSGGEKARVLLARVLAGEPDWILADEPLAALDLAHQQALMAHFRAIAAKGASVTIVLHDLAMARNHADRVLVLDRGRILADGPAADALSEERIASVWQTGVRWLGEEGALALAPQ